MLLNWFPSISARPEILEKWLFCHWLLNVLFFISFPWLRAGRWALKIDPVTAVDETIIHENIVFIFLPAGSSAMNNGGNNTRRTGRGRGQLASLDGIVIRIV